MSGRITLNLDRGTDFRLDVSFEIPDKGITVLFGPSGCGKTTVLRCTAGLERAGGRVVVADRVWQDDARNIFVPAWERRLGYVFQEASLFEHLNVEGNLHFGLRHQGCPWGARPLLGSSGAPGHRASSPAPRAASLRRRTPESGHRACAADDARSHSHGRAGSRRSTGTASRRSCRGSSVFATSSPFPCSTLLTRPTKWPALRIR